MMKEGKGIFRGDATGPTDPLAINAHQELSATGKYEGKNVSIKRVKGIEENKDDTSPNGDIIT